MKLFKLTEERFVDNDNNVFLRDHNEDWFIMKDVSIEGQEHKTIIQQTVIPMIAENLKSAYAEWKNDIPNNSFVETPPESSETIELKSYETPFGRMVLTFEPK
ncbi:MAG: hypothetical protein LLF95_11285 [Bacteroidales bacterium]|nr:hypothetical protein [Bacteroidales bacterium]